MLSSLATLKLDHPEHFTFSKNTVFLGKGLFAENPAHIVVQRTIFGSNVQILNEDGPVTTNNSVIIGDNVKLKPCIIKKEPTFVFEMVIKGPVVIGNSCLIRARKIGPNVFIGDNVVIGEGNVINSNTIILDDSVIAPNTTLPSNCIVGGNPAKFVEFLSEQAQNSLGAELEGKFQEFEREITNHIQKKMKEKEASTATAAPPKAQTDA